MKAAELTKFPWLKHYPERVPHTLDTPEIPAWQILTDTASAYADRIACHYYDQQLTYAEMSDQAHRAAEALVRLGVKPGDRVGILMPNIPEYPIALNGIWMAGGVAVALSPLCVPEEISGLLEATDCRYVIALDLLAPLVLKGSFEPEQILFASLRDRLPKWQQLGYAFAKIRRLGFWPPADGPNQHSFNDQLAAGSGNFKPLVPESLDDPAYILATGGSTLR